MSVREALDDAVSACRHCAAGRQLPWYRRLYIAPQASVGWRSCAAYPLAASSNHCSGQHSLIGDPELRTPDGHDSSTRVRLVMTRLCVHIGCMRKSNLSRHELDPLWRQVARTVETPVSLGSLGGREIRQRCVWANRGPTPLQSRLRLHVRSQAACLEWKL